MDALTMHRHAARLSRAVLHCDPHGRTFKRSQSSFHMNSYCVSGYFHELPTDVRYFANSMDDLLKDMAKFYPSLYISDVQCEEDDDFDPIDMDWD
jgi:hypothetical protein